MWATWCGPCAEPIRKLNQLAADRRDAWKDRVAIVPVSIDDRVDTGRESVAKSRFEQPRALLVGRRRSPRLEIARRTGICRAAFPCRSDRPHGARAHLAARGATLGSTYRPFPSPVSGLALLSDLFEQRTELGDFVRPIAVQVMSLPNVLTQIVKLARIVVLRCSRSLRRTNRAASRLRRFSWRPTTTRRAAPRNRPQPYCGRSSAAGSPPPPPIPAADCSCRGRSRRQRRADHGRQCGHQVDLADQRVVDRLRFYVPRPADDKGDTMPPSHRSRFTPRNGPALR